MYMKAVFPLFHAEPAITEALAREYPGAVPDVVRADHERGWMLMHEVGGDVLDDRPATAWAPVLRTVAGIHRTWSMRIDELLAYGAQDRRVGDSVLPETLVHGDLNPGNVFLNGDRAVIFDWSDACIADPFVDVHLLLFWVDDEEARAALLDAYADGWGGELSTDNVRAAFAASEASAYLHQAESYRAICDALAPDDRWWFDGEEARWRERATAVLAGRRPSRDS
jgi:Ser/Thr protein kinase RdoA (MazF antagonist)